MSAVTIKKKAVNNRNTGANTIPFGTTIVHGVVQLPPGDSGTLMVGGDTNTSNRISLDGGVVLTVAAGFRIGGNNGDIGTAQFAGPTGTLVNNGTIQDDVAGGTITAIEQIADPERIARFEVTPLKAGLKTQRGQLAGSSGIALARTTLA